MTQQSGDRNLIQTLMCTSCRRYAEPGEDRTLWGWRFRQQGLRPPEPRGYVCSGCVSVPTAKTGEQAAPALDDEHRATALSRSQPPYAQADTRPPDGT